MDSIKERFLEKIQNSQTNKAANSKLLLTRAEYDAKVTRLSQLENGDRRIPADSNLLAMYEIVQYDDVSVLQKKGTDKRLVCADEIFDVIKSAHNNATGHGGRHVTHKHISEKFYNITVKQIEAFLSLCEECQLKRARPSKSIVVKPILSKELNSRCQVGLTIPQSTPLNKLKYLLLIYGSFFLI